MHYADTDGKEDTGHRLNWRVKLGITEVQVNYMENKNSGLDSVERRRTLATIYGYLPFCWG